MNNKEKVQQLNELFNIDGPEYIEMGNVVYSSYCINSGSLGGRTTKELGLGIFALSKEERSKISKIAGKIGGRKGGISRSESKLNAVMENLKKAMENDTPEKARERGLKGGVKGNKSQREKFGNEGRTIAEQKWIVTTPNGETLEISNLKKFCRENNLLPNKMCEVGKGKWKQHRGYTCKRLE